METNNFVDAMVKLDVASELVYDGCKIIAQLQTWRIMDSKNLIRKSIKIYHSLSDIIDMIELESGGTEVWGE